VAADTVNLPLLPDGVPGADLLYGDERAIGTSRAPAGQTGPAAVAFMAAGAAAGWSWVRRWRKGK
jgi:hypothetical protein